MRRSMISIPFTFHEITWKMKTVEEWMEASLPRELREWKPNLHHFFLVSCLDFVAWTVEHGPVQSETTDAFGGSRALANVLASIKLGLLYAL